MNCLIHEADAKMIKILYILLLSITLLSAHAQKRIENRNLNDLVLSLSDIYEDAQFLVDSVKVSGDSRMGLWYDFLQDDNITVLGQDEQKSNIDATSGIPDLGIKWASEVNSNFKTGTPNSEDVFSRFRLSSGLDWAIWGEGSFMQSRKERAKQTKVQERDSWIENINIQNIDLRNKLYIIQSIFDAHRLILFKAYQLLILKQYQHLKAMYTQGLINEVPLSEITHEINNVQYSMDLINAYGPQNKELNKSSAYWDLPSGYTDLPKFNLLEEQIASNNKAKLFELERGVTQVERKGKSDFSVKLKLRYNYTEYSSRESKTYPSVGLTVSVPLNFNSSSKQAKYELNEKTEAFEHDRISLLQELRERHYHFSSSKKELLTLENDLEHIKIQLNAEKNKKAKSQQEFTPTTYIDLAKKFYWKQNEILQKQQDLCEEFVSFHLRAGFVNSGDKASLSDSLLLTKQNVQNFDEISTYLWSSFFIKKTNKELLDILKKANINTVFFSPGSSDISKINDFISLCNSSGIEVYRLISENSYAAKDDGVDKLRKKLETIAPQGFAGIHLNIEPHTFDDYRENIDKYTERMNIIFKETRLWCDNHNMGLSVSAPMHLPLENASVLKAEGVDTYIMAYENSNQLKLLNRTINLRNLLGDNTAWAIRISDFNSPEEMNRELDLLPSSNIRKIAYYDCSSLDENFR